MTEREQLEACAKEIDWLIDQLDEAKAGAREVRKMLAEGRVPAALHALDELGEE